MFVSTTIYFLTAGAICIISGYLVFKFALAKVNVLHEKYKMALGLIFIPFLFFMIGMFFPKMYIVDKEYNVEEVRIVWRSKQVIDNHEYDIFMKNNDAGVGLLNKTSDTLRISEVLYSNKSPNQSLSRQEDILIPPYSFKSCFLRTGTIDYFFTNAPATAPTSYSADVVKYKLVKN